MRTLTLVNLVLLALLPLAWTAPLFRAGLLPLFGLSEVSVISGLVALVDEDPFLAAVVALFALIAPLAKTLALAAVHFGVGGHRLLRPVHVLGRLAMADIFLIALYILAAKGVGVGRIETAWGLYLFTFCILASLAVAHRSERHLRRGGAAG